jgi:hypothetical protein
MRKIIFTVLLVAFCSISLFAQSKITKEEYEVYAAIFEHNYKNFKPNEYQTTVAILKNTIMPDLVSLEKHLKHPRMAGYLYETDANGGIESAEFENLLGNFKEVNKNVVDLEKKFSIEYNYDLITKTEIAELLKEGGKESAEYYKKCEPCAFGGNFTWQPFHRKYRNSGGYHSLSRVGFSKDKKWSLVYATIESGDYGSRNFYVLRKSDNKWEVFKYFGGGWST